MVALALMSGQANAARVTLPNLIEAEAYTAHEGIRREATTDENGGQSAAYINNGDFSEYEVSVPTGGIYTLTARVASDTEGGTIEIQSDKSSANVSSVSVNNTGGWQKWTTINSTVELAAGDQTLRLSYSGDNGYLFNVNWFTLDIEGTDSEPTTLTSSFIRPTPENNATLDMNADINIEVDAADSEGSIQEVRLYLDDQFVDVQRVAQYVFSSTRQPGLANLGPGTYQLRADVSNTQGDVKSVSRSFNIVDANNPGGGGDGDCIVSGDLNQWHRVAVTCNGPDGSESDDRTFTDNRFNVTFTNGTRTLVVPGHFAADGSAADTSATNGNQWRAYFSPPTDGTWDYQISFRTGDDIAINNAVNAGNPVSILDGKGGSFDVSGSGNVTRDMRTRGLLQNLDGESQLRFAGTNEVFIEAGMDSPENIFGYNEFDNTTKFENVGSCKGILHEFDPHFGDWNAGDPTWDDDRGKNLIGLVNYISSKGVNGTYIMMNTVNGDGCDAHPWANYNSDGDEKSFDVSKLDQWERVLSHMTAKGILIHAMTQETENQGLLGNRSFTLERKLYYRELVSRFGHHPALQWNLGEEIGNTEAAELKEFAAYLKAVDPYDHPVFLHNNVPSQEELYGPMLGDENFDGPTIQIGNINESDYDDVYGQTRDWIERSTAAGNTWVVTWTEASGGTAPTPFDSVSSTQRVYWMWAGAMAGGGGFEWYLKNAGAGHAYDLAVEDLREFDEYWEQSGHVASFFRDTVQKENEISLGSLKTDNDAINGDDDWVLSDSNSTYIALLRRGDNASLNLAGNGNYDVQWFNPRTGQTTDGGSVSSKGFLGDPPSQVNQDWAVILLANNDDVTDVTPPAASGAFIEQNGLVVVEMESVQATQGWTQKNGDGAIGGYLEWTNANSLNNPGTGLISVKVLINNPGTYQFVWRNSIREGTSTTDANDTFLKIQSDNFYGFRGSDNSIVCPRQQPDSNRCSGRAPEGTSRDGWFKTYRSGGTPGDWSWSTRTSDSDAHSIYAEFNQAGEYEIQISARSKSHAIDRFALFRTLNENNNVDQSFATDSQRSESPAAR